MSKESQKKFYTNQRITAEKTGDKKTLDKIQGKLATGKRLQGEAKDLKDSTDPKKDPDIINKRIEGVAKGLVGIGAAGRMGMQAGELGSEFAGAAKSAAKSAPGKLAMAKAPKAAAGETTATKPITIPSMERAQRLAVRSQSAQKPAPRMGKGGPVTAKDNENYAPDKGLEVPKTGSKGITKADNANYAKGKGLPTSKPIAPKKTAKDDENYKTTKGAK